VNAVLIGMKHCGKSTHGRALAEAWQCDFYDTDDVVVDDYFAETGDRLTVRQLCERLGDEGFRDAEVETLSRLYLQLRDGSSRHVIAPGGRLVTNPNAYPVLERLGTLVYLKVPPEVLFERVMRGGRPPFLSAETPLDDFVATYAERESFYQCYADVVVRLDDSPVADAFQRIREAIEESVRAGK